MDKRKAKLKRKMRVRKKIFGVSSRPRISVFKSNRHIFLQAIDDRDGYTIVSLSSVQKGFREKKVGVNNAKDFGKTFGEQLKAKKIDSAVFDRNGNIYHGVVKQIADGVRESGVKL